MGLTTFVQGGTNSDMVASLWTQDLLFANAEKIFWDRFSGPIGSGMPIIVNHDLEMGPGGNIRVDMVNGTADDGVSGTTALSGSETAAAFYQVTVTPVSYAKAFAVHKSQARLSKHELQQWAKPMAGTWAAGKIDNTIFDTLDAITTDRVYGGDATAKNTIETADVLTADLIAKIRAKALGKLVRPIIVNGQEWYVLVVHPYAAYSLRGDADWLAAQHYAGARDLSNPIFSGLLGAIHGVMLFENSRCEYGTNAGAGANVPYSIGHLVGAEAAGFAWAQQPSFIEETTDYGRRSGAGAEMMYGCTAAVFNSVPIGHVPVMVASANPNA